MSATAQLVVTKTGFSVTLSQPDIMDVIRSRQSEISGIIRSEFEKVYGPIPVVTKKPSREQRREMRSVVEKFLYSKKAKIMAGITAMMAVPQLAFADTSTGFAVAEGKLHAVAVQIIDLVTTLSEPILWGFAVVGFITMVNDRTKGWQKVKSTMWAFLGITLLPGVFSMLTFIGKTVASSFSGGM